MHKTTNTWHSLTGFLGKHKNTFILPCDCKWDQMCGKFSWHWQTHSMIFLPRTQTQHRSA